jgi:uncharacterized protein (TIGR03790 family)
VADAAAASDPVSQEALGEYVPMRASLRLEATNLAVVVNTADPLSVAIGDYYVQKRHIPPNNVARVHFDYQRDALPAAEFTALKAVVENQVGRQVQAYALTWARPYRVGCMSITSAFAFGVDARYCAKGCAATRINAYFNASTARPYDDLRIRPTMSIAAADFAHAKALIAAIAPTRFRGAVDRRSTVLTLTHVD